MGSARLSGGKAAVKETVSHESGEGDGQPRQWRGKWPAMNVAREMVSHDYGEGDSQPLQRREGAWATAGQLGHWGCIDAAQAVAVASTDESGHLISHAYLPMAARAVHRPATAIPRPRASVLRSARLVLKHRASVWHSGDVHALTVPVESLCFCRCRCRCWGR